MNGAELQASPAPLPPDHLLRSGAVIFPGAFDQHGCPLVVFPAEAQATLPEELRREEVSHFIHYCLRLHNIRGEESLLSVVVDLRQASLAVARFIAETLLLLEVSRRIVHSVYIVQPKKKDVLKQLGKLLTPSSSKQHRPVLFKRVFLKEVFELSNYIDRSQLPSSLGGYLIYCHKSWVAFVKEIDAFVQEFLLVVNRLPSCIWTLQALAKRPVPADLERLQEFCCVNQAHFQQLRRDLGLDDLLKHCEGLLEKLRFPEKDPCFHAMAGTLLYTHTALEMLHNYNRITAAVEKVELLWQQVFSRAHVQLQLLHLQREAQQIQEQMFVLHREKVQPYRIEVAKDVHRAEEIRLEFEASVYTHAMALVRRAEDVMHTLAETVPFSERKPAEPWLEDLSRLKENLSSAVQHLYQTLRTVSDFHHTCNRCKSWYGVVLRESLLQELLWSGRCELSRSLDLSSCRRGVQSFLRRNPCPEVQELVKLAHLANAITDPHLRHTGTQLSHRCMTLRRLLTSAGPIPLHDLQLALQWQYEFLKGHHTTPDITSPEDERVSCGHVVSQCESLCDLAKWPSVGDCRHQTSSALGSSAGKPPSLSSFDSGFDGAASSHLDSRSRREPLPRILGNGDSAFKSKPLHGQIDEENIVSVSDSEDQREALGFSLKRDSTRASIQIVPKITSDSLNLEIKVKRSATLPKNPWLSLPIDDLESSYTVTITPSSSREPRSPGRARDRPSPTEELGSAPHQSQQSFEESELDPVGNVLSSTLTDIEDKPSSVVDGDPSLLWDTFDLHNLRQDSYERLDVSLGDWVQREQQELREVEETLDRAAEILQEEENVLAQEVVLDELLRSEDLHKHWPLWTEGHQLDPMSDYKTPIVLDTGSGLMKAGFADQDLPTTVFPTVIGRPKYEEVMNGSVERELYVGHDAQHMRGVLTLKYPIRNGIVSNWDEMEMIWHHAFQQLCVSPEDHPVLLTEAAMNPLQNRQRSVELMFEAFSVPLAFVALQAVLALYASGRTTGVVLDSGDGVSHTVPVFEGYCLPHAVQRFDLAGSHVTLQLQKLLLEQGVCMQTSAELEIVREMKERCCCVALDYDAELKSASEVHYTLPDGRIVSLASERFRAPEILFRPELIGRDHYGMHESVFRSILQSDIDLRRSFVGNVLLSGGNTLLPGLPARLRQEMRLLCPADLSVSVSSPSDRDFSVWRGGAALANMADLSSAWISADEYEEFGPQIVFRKCF
uniref:Si:ch211-241j12.3 n=1 Tax=Cyprinus carpio carpio TaxID=630221 RepID=A0A9J7Y0F1_CYPCA